MTDITEERFGAIREEAEKRRKEFRDKPGPKIQIGMATCGIASGALETKKAFEEVLTERNINAQIRTVGCVGHCYAEPVVIIDNPDSGFPPIFYHEVTPGKAKMLAKLFLQEGDPRFEHVLGATVPNDMIPSIMDFPRFNQEKRVVMEKCGHINPDDIYDYIADGGYESLSKAIKQEPDQIIQQITASGLRGRGARDFPQAKNGNWQERLREQIRLLYAMLMKETRVRIWTEPFLKAIRIRCLKEWRSVRMQSARKKGLSMSGRNILLR